MAWSSGKKRMVLLMVVLLVAVGGWVAWNTKLKELPAIKRLTCTDQEEFNEPLNKCIPVCDYEKTGRRYNVAADACVSTCDTAEHWSKSQQVCLNCGADRRTYDETSDTCVCRAPQWEPKDPSAASALDEGQCQIACRDHEVRDPSDPDVKCMCKEGFSRHMGVCKPNTSALACAGVGDPAAFRATGLVPDGPTTWSASEPSQCGPRIPVDEAHGRELQQWCETQSEGKFTRASLDSLGRLVCTVPPPCDPRGLVEGLPSCQVATQGHPYWARCESTEAEKVTACGGAGCNGQWDTLHQTCAWARADNRLDIKLQVIAPDRLEGYVDFALWPVAYGEQPAVWATVSQQGQTGSTLRAPLRTLSALEKPEGRTRRLFVLEGIRLVREFKYDLVITQERGTAILGSTMTTFTVPTSSADVDYQSFPLELRSLTVLERDKVFASITNSLTELNFWNRLAKWAGAGENTSFLQQVDQKMMSKNPLPERLLLLPKASTKGDLSITQMTAFLFCKIIWDPSGGQIPGFLPWATHVKNTKTPRMRTYVQSVGDVVDPPGYTECYYVGPVGRVDPAATATAPPCAFYAIVPLTKSKSLDIGETYTFRLWAVAYAPEPRSAEASYVPTYWKWEDSDARSAPWTVSFEVPTYTSDLCRMYVDDSVLDTVENPLNYYLLNTAGACVRPAAADYSTLQRVGNLEAVRASPNRYYDASRKATAIVEPWRPVDIVVENLGIKVGTTDLFARKVTLKFVGPSGKDIARLEQAYKDALLLDASLAAKRVFATVRDELLYSFRWTSLTDLVNIDPLKKDALAMQCATTKAYVGDWNNSWLPWVQYLVTHLDTDNKWVDDNSTVTSLYNKFDPRGTVAPLVSQVVSNLAYNIDVQVPPKVDTATESAITLYLYHTTDKVGKTACANGAQVTLPNRFDLAQCDRNPGLCRQTNVNPAEGMICEFNMPKGAICIWPTSRPVPDNWLICDGRGATPDLRDRFVKGSTSEPGDHFVKGGLEKSEVAITNANLPAHSHSGRTTDTGNHSHTNGTVGGGGHTHDAWMSEGGNPSSSWGAFRSTDRAYASALGYYTDFKGGEHEHTFTTMDNYDETAHTHAFVSNSTGAGGVVTLDIRPPFIKAIFIMKIA